MPTYRQTQNNKKAYSALLSQVGIDAPTIESNGTGANTPLINTVGAIVWSYAGVGYYLGTLAGAFPDATKIIFKQPINYTGGTNESQPYFGMGWNDVNSIYLTAVDLKAAGAYEDDLMYLTSIEFEIYP